MNIKKSLANQIRLFVLLSIILVASIFMLADIITENIEYNSKTTQIRKDFYKQHNEIIKQEVENVYDMIYEEKAKNEPVDTGNFEATCAASI